MLSQWAEIRHKHHVTYIKLKSGANSTKRLRLPHCQHHETSLPSLSPICHLSPSGWPPTLKNSQFSICQPWDNNNIHKKYLPDLPKSSGGCSIKLSPYDIHYTTHLLRFGEAETAPQVARRLEEIKGTTISNQTVQNVYKKAGMKAVGKKKWPYLKPGYYQARMDFAKKYKYWTVEDWKRVIWSDETKINQFGSDGKKWAWMTLADAKIA